MQVSSCHRERRKNKGKERKVAILALLAGGGGGVLEPTPRHVLGVFFSTISILCNMEFFYRVSNLNGRTNNAYSMKEILNLTYFNKYIRIKKANNIQKA